MSMSSRLCLPTLALALIAPLPAHAVDYPQWERSNETFYGAVPASSSSSSIDYYADDTARTFTFTTDAWNGGQAGVGGTVPTAEFAAGDYWFAARSLYPSAGACPSIGGSYAGTFSWFRTTVTVDDAASLGAVVIEDKYHPGHITVNDHVEVWVNGEFTGVYWGVSAFGFSSSGFMGLTGVLDASLYPSTFWATSGPLQVPASWFDDGENEVAIAFEERCGSGISGGLGHLSMPGFEVSDADGDGVPDEDDVCDGGDDTLDLDEDGVPDGCDACDGDDLSGDSDVDGTCDDIDPCDDDADDDSDGDGSCDSVDVCAGDDGYGDADGDGVCGDLDPCPTDANDDSDGDGSCDSADACLGYDDGDDGDGDALPDHCDACPDDAQNDADGDGVCGDLDVCPGTGASDVAEGVATRGVGTNRWADIDGDGDFDTTGPNGSRRAYSLEDTQGCNCAQIIDECGYGAGHLKSGCSNSVMDWWTGLYDQAGEPAGQCH